jgi:hypothetical protein
MVPVSTTSPSGQVLGSNVNLTYDFSTQTLSCDTVRGRSYLEVLDQTTPADVTEYYTNAGIIDTRYKNVVQTRIWTNAIFGYPPIDGYTGFQIGNDTQGTQIILADADTFKNAITNNAGNFRIWNDNFDPAGLVSAWGIMYEMSRFGINNFYTNNYQYIPFDMPILNADSYVFLYTPCVPNSPLTQFVTPVVRAGGTNIYDITIKVSGRNPFSRSITVSTQYAFNFTLTAVAGATFPTTLALSPSIGSESLTLNGSTFLGYIFNSTGTGVAYNYFQSAISVWNIFQPVGQLTWIITPDNTGNDIDTYVITIDLNRTSPALTGVSYTARTGNLDGSFITLKGTSTSNSFVRSTGSGTLTTTTTPTNTLLTTTRSGTNRLKINYFDTDVSASTLQVSSMSGAGKFYPIWANTYVASTAAGRQAYLDLNQSMSIIPSTGVVSITNLSAYSANVTTNLSAYGANFGTGPRFESAPGNYTVAGFINSNTTINNYTNIQIGAASSTYQSWFIGARNNTDYFSRLSISPYGSAQDACWYVDGIGGTTQAGFCTAKMFLIPQYTYGSTSSYYASGASIAWVSNYYKYKVFMSLTSVAASGGTATLTMTNLSTNWYNNWSMKAYINGISTTPRCPLQVGVNFSGTTSMVVTMYNFTSSAWTGTLTLMIEDTLDE